MNICCPQCGFSRDVPASKLPAGSAIATCPKCGCRFRLARQKDAAPPDIHNPAAQNQEEEEDIRVTASRAYAAEAERYERERQGEEAARTREKASNPWELAPSAYSWPAAFCQTIMRVMFSASLFFSSIKPQCQHWRPLLFYLLLCVIQTSMERLWSGVFISMLSSSAAADPQLENMLEMLGPKSDFALSLLLRCGMMALQLYILSFLMYMMYRLAAPGRSTFALIFQIMAYSSAPAVLCVVPIIGSVAGWAWGLACLLIGCKTAMRIDWPRTLCGLIPLVLVFAPVFIQVMGLMRQ